jgi:transcriptional regulator with XRE-family HTH domain
MKPEEPKPPIHMDYFEDLTGEIKSEEPPPCDHIGERIHRLRQDKGLSISELSKLTGFDEQMLSAMEAGTHSPQLGTLIKLSKALESALQRLISAEGEHLYVITRRNESKVATRSTTGQSQRSAYTYMSMAPEVKGRHMEPLIVVLEKIDDETPSVHDGEEFLYVLEGEVALTIGDEHFKLQPGDSAYYLSTTPHLVAAARDHAKILAVIYSG